MAIKNFTTKIDVHQTVSEIHMLLARHGAKKIMFDYEDDGKIIAICFSIETPEGMRAVKLPSNADRVKAVLTKQKASSKTAIDASEEQAERVAWRIIKDWLAAQLAILETEMVENAQIFLPYFINRAGVTLYEAYSTGQLMLPE
jgi:hypothetical protein